MRWRRRRRVAAQVAPRKAPAANAATAAKVPRRYSRGVHVVDVVAAVAVDLIVRWGRVRFRLSSQC